MITLSDAGAHPGELSDAAYPAHLLGYWVRDAKALSLEDAVWRLTGQMASAYRVEGRGVIAPGKVADLVAFDSATVGIKERKRLFDLPTGSDRLVGIPKGVEHIWVGGVQTRKDGADVAGAAPGAMVRGLGDRLF